MNPFYETQAGNYRLMNTEWLSFPEHLHSHSEFMIVRQGETTLTLNDHAYHMTKGDCIIVYPEQIHSFYSDSEAKLSILVFDNTLAGSLKNVMKNFRPTQPYLPADQVPADVLLALEKLQDLDYSTQPFLVSAWIQVIISLLIPHLALQESNQPQDQTLVHQLITYMAEHFREPLSLESIARELHVNKYYLSHIFSDKLKISFPQYLNHLRTDYAATLMVQSDKSLTEIWEESGFSSQRSFNRVFHSLQGMSPLEYRKKIPFSGK